MGRLHRMRAAQFQVWEPPESPLRVEYTNDILREAARRDSEVLFGTRNNSLVRICAARKHAPSETDPRLAGLELLGTFATRPRSEVFLTDTNLEHMQRTGGLVALVLAGTRGGFFVHDSEGAIQTIKSYLEFELPEMPAAPKPSISNRIAGTWWITAALIAIVGFLLAGWTPARVRSHGASGPLELALHDHQGQLLISWNRASFSGVGRLEISDGSDRNWIPIDPEMISATYVPRSPEVEIRLIAGSRNETARFVVSDPQFLERMKLNRRISQLESDAAALQSELDTGRSRIAQIEKRIARQIR